MHLNVMSKLTFTPRLLFAKENASPAWCHTLESVVAMPQTTVKIGLIQEMFGCNSLSVAQHSVLVHHSTSDFPCLLEDVWIHTSGRNKYQLQL